MAKKLLALLFLLLPLSAYPQGTNNAAGNLTASGSSCIATNCVSLRFAPNTIYSTITLSGTWSATVQFEVSGDFGVTWVAAPATTSATSNGTTQFNVGGYTMIRARVSAFVSGTVVTTIIGSTQSGGSSSSGGSGGIISGSTGTFSLSSFGGVDDDVTDNCANGSVAAFTAAVNGYSGPGAPTAIIAPGTSNKAYKLATNANSCTFAFTRTLGVNVILWGTIDCAQTAVSCIQFGATGQSSIVGGSIYSLSGTGVLTGGANLTTAGVYSEPGVDILNITGIRFTGPQGGTTNGGFGANNATLGNCTNYAIFIDTPFATGAISGNTIGITSASATSGGCGIGNPAGGATGFNTLYITNNTIASGAFGTLCGSTGIIDGGSYGSIRDNTIYGFGVDVRLQGIGHIVDGNDLDSINCANHGVNATIQFGGASSSTAVIGVTISNNKPQVATNHAAALLDKAGDSTATIQGFTITGNQNIVTQSSSPIGFLLGSSFNCASGATPAIGCYIAGNQNFSGVAPTGTTQTGWFNGVSFVGVNFADTQAANVGSTLIVNAPMTNTYLVTCKVVLETAATTSSTLPQCVISWTDQNTAVTQTVTVTPIWASGTVGCSGATTNTVGNACYGTVVISSSAAGAINFSTANYASVGGTTMKYLVAAKVLSTF